MLNIPTRAKTARKIHRLMVSATVIIPPVFFFASRPFLAATLSILGIPNPAGVSSLCMALILGGVVYYSLEGAYRVYKRTNSIERARVRVVRNFRHIVLTLSIAVAGAGVGLLVVGPPLSTTIFFSVTAIGLAAIIPLAANLPPAPPSDLYRGIGVDYAVPEGAQWQFENHKYLIRWGLRYVTRHDEMLHGLIWGNTGTGKTTLLIHQILSRVLQREREENVCGLVSDPKGNLLSVVEIGVGYAGIVVIDPFYLDHPSAVAWDIAADIADAPSTREFSIRLISAGNEQETDGKNKYFQGNAQQICEAVWTCLLIVKGGKAELRDLILICRSTEDIKAFLLAHHPQPAPFIERLSQRESGSIVSTLRQALDEYQIVAAAFHHCKRKIRLRDPLRNGQWIVIGSHPKFNDTMQKLTSLFVDSFFKEVLSLPDVSPENPRRVYTVLDEMQGSQRFVTLPQALEMGRSKGLSIWLTALSYAGMSEVYGENVTNSIFGLCRHRALLPLDLDSAKRVSELLGDAECYRTTTTENNTSSSRDYSISSGSSESIQSVKTLTAQELSDMNVDQSLRTGIRGYFVSPSQGIHRGEVSWDEVNQFSLTSQPESMFTTRLQSNDPRLSLAPHTADERALLRLPVEQKQSEKSERPKLTKKKRGKRGGERTHASHGPPPVVDS